ncbi:methyl-accepting chemotaxis protein [Oceanobacillus bengalensis]|uniref:Methyl-accepting chemotaxis protein n=1 Tax=Oceanobacillus bengalensis TaxID=1435466 RepID=A0A494Z2W0_9BACI|nr:methyl-accepting chemotaxis protein [Oceanobacillus bengalensis]RKQ16866.1 methyl-accepting chemotaxis protein [Oceanobacillus bengalensis]
MKKIARKKKGKKNIPFNWKDIRISNKYLIAFFTTITLFLMGSAIVFLQLHSMQKDMESIEEQNNLVNDMNQVISLIQLKDVQISDYLLTQRTVFIESYHTYSEEIKTYFANLEPKLSTDKEKAILEQIVTNDKSMDDILLEKMVPAVEEGRTVYATSQRNYSTNLRTETSELATQLIETIKEEQVKTVASTSSSMANSTIILILSNLSVIIIGTLFMALISRKIRLSLTNLVKITSEVSRGNLSGDSMKYNGKDEIGQLAAAINLMKENMHNIVQKVTDAAKSVSERSGALNNSSKEVREGNMQIASTMEELSSGAETQANGASDLAENMNTFLQTVLQSEQNGKEIVLNSEEVLALTTDGTTLMKESVNQMKRIDTIVSEAVNKVQKLDKQSAEISKLVLVIKGIADQTNLLSLNAAIEAARAGEHGKGFAVVADEVRKLSDQVASSVEEIRTIVTNIQAETTQVVSSLNTGYHEVHEGKNQIEATGKNFETINHAVTTMVGKISTISSNLKNIADNSNNMNQTIEDIASVSEESAAGVEEAAASAQQTAGSMEEVSHSADQLLALADQLTEELKTFKL